MRVVLVETSHPGNIGAAARAMKNMGLGELVLVRPKLFPHADATARASGADDILYNAQVADTVNEAIGPCTLVLGMSARRRNVPMATFDVREAVAKIQTNPGPVAVLFGCERSGLSNEDLDKCHGLVQIPTADYASLNLAMAVQVFAYEWLMAQNRPTTDQPTHESPTAAAMEHFYGHMETILLQTGFLDPDNPRQLMRRLRRIFNRSDLDPNELKILRGILSAVEPKTQ
ncbi:MAG: RNA methyltransferase [Pseudomonadota bacterium]